MKIAGEGPDRARLQKLAGPTVEFLGYQEEEKLRELYAHAAATLFPGNEDFGLVPLESIACGTPVIALGQGGALETMIEGETTEFFTEPTTASLVAAMERFERKTFSAERCRNHARNFSRKTFEDAILTKVGEMMS